MCTAFWFSFGMHPNFHLLPPIFIIFHNIPGPCLYIKRLSWYMDSHCKDETVVRPSYLCNGNRYTGKTASLYWEYRISLAAGYPHCKNSHTIFILNGNLYYKRCILYWNQLLCLLGLTEPQCTFLCAQKRAIFCVCGNSVFFIQCLPLGMGLQMGKTEYSWINHRVVFVGRYSVDYVINTRRLID